MPASTWMRVASISRGANIIFITVPTKSLIRRIGLITFGRTAANRYIQPIDRDTQFHGQIEFSNLEEDEFAVLMIAVTLEETMRHKIGYGKPMGLGSIYLYPTKSDAG